MIPKCEAKRAVEEQQRVEFEALCTQLENMIDDNIRHNAHKILLSRTNVDTSTEYSNDVIEWAIKHYSNPIGGWNVKLVARDDEPIADFKAYRAANSHPFSWNPIYLVLS